jgi:SAF domain
MSVLSDGNGGGRGAPLPPPPQPTAGGAAVTTAAPPASRGRRAALAGPRSAGDVPTRRRWGRFAAGSCLALLGGLLFAALYVSAGSRDEVVVAAHDLRPYEPIDRDDLRIERVAAEPDVAVIAGDDLDELVGRVVTSGVPEGAVLASDHVFEEGADVVGPGEGIAGVELSLDEAPRRLVPGDSVVVAIAPVPGSGEAEREVEGWLLAVGERNDDTDRIDVSVVVPRSEASNVSVAAAGDRVSLVLTRGG